MLSWSIERNQWHEMGQSFTRINVNPNQDVTKVTKILGSNSKNGFKYLL